MDIVDLCEKPLNQPLFHYHGMKGFFLFVFCFFCFTFGPLIPWLKYRELMTLCTGLKDSIVHLISSIFR